MTEREETIQYLLYLDNAQILEFSNLEISKKALILLSDAEFDQILMKLNFLDIYYQFDTYDYNSLIMGNYIFIKSSAERF